MSDTFMLVGEMGGDCPIHGRRILAGASYQDIKEELGVALRTLARPGGAKSR